MSRGKKNPDRYQKKIPQTKRLEQKTRRRQNPARSKETFSQTKRFDQQTIQRQFQRKTNTPAESNELFVEDVFSRLQPTGCFKPRVTTEWDVIPFETYEEPDTTPMVYTKLSRQRGRINNCGRSIMAHRKGHQQPRPSKTAQETAIDRYRSAKFVRQCVWKILSSCVRNSWQQQSENLHQSRELTKMVGNLFKGGSGDGRHLKSRPLNKFKH